MPTYPRYRDSGTPWLGDVPEHWNVKRLKVVVANVNEQTSHQDRAASYVALENVESWTGRIRISLDQEPFEGGKTFRADDVLFGKLRPYLAKVARPTSAGVCVGEFLV